MTKSLALIFRKANPLFKLLDKSVRKLAKFIRSEIEIWIKDNPDIDEYDLCGACAIASYTVYRCLIKLKYKPKFIMAEGDIGSHCWVELHNYVIDLTATQFNMALPKILITNKKYYFEAIPELKKYTVKGFNQKAISHTQNWDHQSPIVYTKEIRKLIRNLHVEFN